MEQYLRAMLPRFLSSNIRLDYITFSGKHDLLHKIEDRLRGLQRIPDGDRIFVLVDRDQDNCEDLKQELESKATRAGIVTRSTAGASDWQLVNRIVVEELEAWYFGDWDAVVAAYPRAPRGVAQKRPYRRPDDIAGGTWERFEREMKPVFRGGLAKTQAAQRIGGTTDPDRCRSPSFQAFWRAVLEAAA